MEPSFRPARPLATPPSSASLILDKAILVDLGLNLLSPCNPFESVPRLTTSRHIVALRGFSPSTRKKSVRVYVCVLILLSAGTVYRVYAFAVISIEHLMRSLSATITVPNENYDIIGYRYRVLSDQLTRVGIGARTGSRWLVVYRSSRNGSCIWCRRCVSAIRLHGWGGPRIAYCA